MNTRLLIPAALGALLLGAPLAFAARGPHEGYMEHQYDAADISNFNVSGNQTANIASLAEPEDYRVCLTRHSREVTIVHDNDQTLLAGGRCTEVNGKNISVIGNADGGPSDGYFMVHHHGPRPSDRHMG